MSGEYLKAEERGVKFEQQESLLTVTDGLISGDIAFRTPAV